MRFEVQNFTASDGTQLGYVEAGSGRPLFYLMGFGEDREAAHRCFEKWSDSFHCYCFDYRGYGSSELSEDAGVERAARDLHELLEYLRLADVALVGYSMGGSIAFSYARQFGTQYLERLVLVDTAPKLINEDDWRVGLWQGRYVRSDFERDLQVILDDPSLFQLSFYVRAATKTRYAVDNVVFPEYNDRDAWLSRAVEVTGVKLPLIKRIFTFTLSDEKKRCVRRYWETMTGGDWRDILGTIDVPTLCLYADPGSFYYSATAEYTASKIPNATTRAIANASHTCPKENLAEFVAQIADFCARD